MCWSLLSLLACGSSGDRSGFSHASLPEPLAEVDVLVIGAGGSGLAAAYEADAAGAEVLVIEREAAPGGSSLWGGFLWGAGTSVQEALGEEDSPEAALEEWADFTDGGDPADPWVQALAWRSGEIIDWVLDLGLSYDNVASDEDASSSGVRRLHTQPTYEDMPVEVLAALLADLIRTSTTATGLVVENGRVIGARVEADGLDEDAWVSAGAVVVATGGFARSDAWRAEALGEVSFPVGFECLPLERGEGLDMLVEAGAEVVVEGALGGYVNGVLDPRIEDEILRADGLQSTLIVDRNGERSASEALFRSLSLGRVFLERGPLYAIVGPSQLALLQFSTMAYALEENDVDSLLDADEYLALAGLSPSEDLEHLADSIGVDREALVATVARYNELVLGGEDLDFGRAMYEPDYVEGPYYALPLAFGAAKSFGGALLGEGAEVLERGGDPIPGLYAAGELAGMLGGPQIGGGISGSMTAVFLTGRVAGQSAAAEGLAERARRRARAR